VVIGSRTNNGGTNFYGQYFNGQLSNIRISNVARYTGTFIPPTTVVTDANTKLALDGSTYAMLDDVSASNHTITQNGAVVTAIGSYSRSFGTQGLSPQLSTIFSLGVFPISVVGWTMTGPGISQTTTVTEQNVFGNQTEVVWTPAFTYAPGTYTFTPP
jgi:hypothetical protein